ncbi:M12 family metallopeptidase [Silvanigrella aquatica]|uniref:Peptidase M12A domain-containing protein n=1 Tax=Silvanigrella aquatica TaxID=1915309 RepID=A0A1L4CWV5_9BACT|nr:M12 family metallopeptidase [Silvanigrella aquatica]APJ02429.1 hypothetical protein AXG55_00140 [Silvanigrella aquatica]
MKIIFKICIYLKLLFVLTLCNYAKAIINKDKFEIIEGDILILKSKNIIKRSANILPNIEIKEKYQNGVLKINSFHWNGTIYYRFDSKNPFSEENKNKILFVMNEIKDIAKIRFIELKNNKTENLENKYYLNITNNSGSKLNGDLVGCFASVGRSIEYNGGFLNLSSTYTDERNLPDSCFKKDNNKETLRIIRHKFMHILGFEHEQSRHDRDYYIIINEKNINENFKKNSSKNLKKFEKGALSYISKYDTESIMHYDSYAFSGNTNKPTLAKLDGSILSKNYEFSDSDKIALKRVYGEKIGIHEILYDIQGSPLEYCKLYKIKSNANSKGQVATYVGKKSWNNWDYIIGVEENQGSVILLTSKNVDLDDCSGIQKLREKNLPVDMEVRKSDHVNIIFRDNIYHQDYIYLSNDKNYFFLDKNQNFHSLNELQHSFICTHIIILKNTWCFTLSIIQNSKLIEFVPSYNMELFPKKFD